MEFRSFFLPYVDSLNISPNLTQYQTPSRSNKTQTDADIVVAVVSLAIIHVRDDRVCTEWQRDLKRVKEEGVVSAVYIIICW
jgi:hypothetical protein